MYSSVNETRLSATEAVLYSGLKQMRVANEVLWNENIELRRKIELLEDWKASQSPEEGGL